MQHTPISYRSALPASEFTALGAWASTFWPFQRRWLFDPARYAVANKGRQIGFSHTTGALSVLWGAFHGELTTVISVGEREAGEVLDKVKRHAALLRMFGSKQARVVRSTSSEIQFASGGRVIALPSTGGRSFTGNVFLDEFAYHADPKAVWDAAAAVTMLGFRMRVVSTPNGTGNEFHLLWKKAQDPRFGWSAHQVSIEDAVADGYPVDMNACWTLAKGNPRVFDQMFRCSFLDNEFQYIPSELIEACSYDALESSPGEFFAGLDLGRTAHLTSLEIVRKDDNEPRVRWRVHGESKKRTTFEDVESLVAKALEQWKCRRVCLDATGIGAFPAEQLQRKFGADRIEPVVFNLTTKEDLATGLYQNFAERTIRIPRTDPHLRDDITAIRRIVTSAGNVRYDAPVTDEGHSDRAWALALALHGCSSPENRRHEVYDHSHEDYDE